MFAVFKSRVPELTVAVLLMLVPTDPFAVATSVTVAEPPLGREANVTVRLLPEPPHTPPPVELQETKVADDGKLSVTVTVWATAAPLFVITSV